jgi:hypothetical protein
VSAILTPVRATVRKAERRVNLQSAENGVSRNGNTALIRLEHFADHSGEWVTARTGLLRAKSSLIVWRLNANRVCMNWGKTAA